MSNTTKPTVRSEVNGTTVVARSVELARKPRQFPAKVRASDTTCAVFLVTVATRTEETTFSIVVELDRRGRARVIADNRHSGGGPEGRGLACTVALECVRSLLLAA